MIQEIPAKGIKGFLLYSPFSKNYFFRVYDKDNKKIFKDYDIRCEEIEIEILTNWNSLYEDDESDTNNFLEWSSIARGRSKKMKEQDQDLIQYTCAPILVPVSTGILSGAASVIGAYIFRPIWNRIKSLWEPKQEEKTICQIK